MQTAEGPGSQLPGSSSSAEPAPQTSSWHVMPVPQACSHWEHLKDFSSENEMILASQMWGCAAFPFILSKLNIFGWTRQATEYVSLLSVKLWWACYSNPLIHSFIANENNENYLQSWWLNQYLKWQNFHFIYWICCITVNKESFSLGSDFTLQSILHSYKTQWW